MRGAHSADDSAAAEASADVLSRPGAAMAPAVETSIAPTEAAEADTGVAEAVSTASRIPAAPVGVSAIAVTSNWTFEERDRDGFDENARAARHANKTRLDITISIFLRG